ncbi:type IV toxin-antitoxin system AbiEi family antitoxin [Williamsia sp. CHRR-6]|uniref:type IV toxin-antitoxin system AbiEi family antitoxin n=1 Tax=Williamsia sp. CHRR-6 TaxID=2835871 RepID=UPI001BD95459|nr:hypothetical protein [Williamsia sp. CHRR-6]MBT0565900.1 hypothetical protein [Williamsia sp. CHRR-6]
MLITDITARETVRPATARTAAQLRHFGMTRGEVERAVAEGVLTRLAPGYFLPSAEVGEFPEDRHLALGRGVLGATAAPSALARITAAAAWGLPIVDADLSRVHLARVAGTVSGSRASSISVMHRNVAASDVCFVDGVPVTTPARTLVDLARTASVRCAVTALDAALHRKLCTRTELARQLGSMTRMWGASRAAETIERADHRAESPLESWSRIVFAGTRLPQPEPQREFFDRWGRLMARVDFFWEELGLVGECDGMGKYFGAYTQRSAQEVVNDEKIRTQQLLDLGLGIVRWNIRDLERGPSVVIDRVAHALAARRH